MKGREDGLEHFSHEETLRVSTVQPGEKAPGKLINV